MIMKNILWLLIIFLAQPVFILGLFYAFWNRNKRLNYVRKNYRLNFNPSPFEVTDYLFKTLILGIVISVILGVVGVPLTIEWYVIYQVVTILLLIISGTRFIHPLFTFSISSIILFTLDRLGKTIPLTWLRNIASQDSITINFQLENISGLILNSLFIISVILLFSGFLMKKKDRNKFYPILHSSKRGKVVAKYQKKSILLLPLIVIVPGTLIEPIAAWWPLFNIGGERHALLLLPFLIGFHFTISTQLLGNALESMKKDLQVLAMISLLLTIISYFYMSFSIVSMIIVLVGGLVVLYRHRQRENMWTFKYGPADEGLRVIGIRPDSPAERMGLSIGVIITHINEQEMNTKEEFYEVISYNRSYIKMRLKRSDGEIIMVETPLYENDYNNLGLLIL